MNMDSASTLVESLTKTELRRLLTQLSGDIELSNSANTADELQGMILMWVGLGDVVGIQVDRSKKLTKFIVNRRKGSQAVGKIIF
jgi:hypothetical protein